MSPGFVYVVESPTPFDLLNGQTEGRALCDELELAGITYSHHVAADAETLEIVLRLRIATDCKRRALPPTVILVMYASDRGLRLTSGETVPWDDLRGMLLAVRYAQPVGTMICIVRGTGGGLSDLFVREG
jgi:hypothetical protein